MNLESFCVALASLNLSQPRQAVEILWFADRQQPGSSLTAGDLARSIRDAGLGNPHSTKLGEAAVATGHVLRSGDQLRIKPVSREVVRAWVAAVLAPAPPEVQHDTGFLPEAVWIGTPSYIEKIAKQINGCYEFGFFDGAAVMARRIIETLLIECYEHLQIADRIKTNGEYKMLGDIINGAVDQQHLTLSRDTKKALKEIKLLGDRSAHSRRFTAVQNDLDRLRPGVRLVVQELLHLAALK
jgi:hypothetical protein